MTWNGTGTPSSSATYRLTSLTNVNAYMNFTTGDDTARDALLTTLLDRTTAAIENYCERKFLSRQYRLERYDGDGESLLFLKQRPVRSIHAVGVGARTAIIITCSATDAVHASVDITSDGVTINQIGGSPSGSSDVLFSSYATISAVAAQINTYTGWSASVSTGDEQQRASDLLDVYGGYCLDQNLDLQIPDTPIYDFKLYKEGGKEMGILHRTVGWAEGTMNVIITYTAGYLTVPYDVEQACLQMIATAYNQSKRDLGLKSETLGDYSYTIADGGSIRGQNPLFAGGVTDLLSPWKNIWCV